ncbi:receptor homology region, transmembrane domain- and RING domain-containing protein 1-like [Panicum miliaceum]|uniref:Receptor homology region, transmembrane domain-and RING domain-containing protein 1-like n=1 Tax=Panicum miliaceum TaxID=4540 RepID=A0A3L6S3T9_PANMI|nr:receptor homology region, transmembrane domain- and RING domain-containing protein 1-like [Panicum miliaceum]
MRCPVCCKIAYPVRPWKAPPTSAALATTPRSPSTMDLEAQLPLPLALEAAAAEETTAA